MVMMMHDGDGDGDDDVLVGYIHLPKSCFHFEFGSLTTKAMISRRHFSPRHPPVGARQVPPRNTMENL